MTGFIKEFGLFLPDEITLGSCEAESGFKLHKMRVYHDLKAIFVKLVTYVLEDWPSCVLGQPVITNNSAQYLTGLAV